MDVVLVGTGAAVATQRRRMCVAVRGSDGWVLVDTAGGGEVLVGLRDAGIDAATVRHVALTHPHPDHAYGLPFLAIAQLVSGGRPDLTVHATGRTLEAVRQQAEATLEAPIRQGLEWRDVVFGTPTEIAGLRFTPAPARHGSLDGAAGFVIAEAGNPRTLAISGDTIPTAEFAEAARGAALLIHEGGLDERFAQSDIGRRVHSTAAGAAGVAHDAAVGTLVLAHLEDERHVEGARLLREAAAVYAGTVLLGQDGWRTTL